MRLESEHTHYRTRFEMYAHSTHDDVGPYVLQVIYNWLCGKDCGSRTLRRGSWILPLTAYTCRRRDMSGLRTRWRR